MNLSSAAYWVGIYLGGPLVWAVVGLPVIGVLLAPLAENGRRAAGVVAACCHLATVGALAELAWALFHVQAVNAGPWVSTVTVASLPSGLVIPPAFVGVGASASASTGLALNVGVRADSTTMVMLAVITFVASMVLWYTARYHGTDQAYRRMVWVGAALEACALATSAAPNLFQIVVAVGVAAALVWAAASHWWQGLEDAVSAWRGAAQLMVGELALLLAAVVYLTRYAVAASEAAPTASADTLSLGRVATEIAAPVLGVGQKTHVLIVVLLLIGLGIAAAQGPLGSWLSDIRNAPLLGLVMAGMVMPVAALVALARLQPTLLAVWHTGSVVAVVAGGCAVVAGVAALRQTEVAHAGLLAFVSQLSLAVVAVGVGGYSEAIMIAAVALIFGALYMLAMANLVQVFRSRLFIDLGEAVRRLPVTGWALGLWALGVAGMNLVSYTLLAGAIRNQYPAPGNLAIALNAHWVTAVVVVLCTLATALVSLFAWRTWFRVGWGAPRERRGFRLDRIRDVAPGLRRPLLWLSGASVVAVVVLIPAVPWTLSHLVYATDYASLHLPFATPLRQNLSVEPVAVVLAVVAGAAGLVIARLWSRAWGAADAAEPAWAASPVGMSWGLIRAGRVTMWVTDAFVGPIETEVVEAVGGLLADGVDEAAKAARAGGTLNRVPRRLAMATLSSVVVIAIALVVMAAQAHGMGR